MRYKHFIYKVLVYGLYQNLLHCFFGFLRDMPAVCKLLNKNVYKNQKLIQFF